MFVFIYLVDCAFCIVFCNLRLQNCQINVAGLKYSSSLLTIVG